MEQVGHPGAVLHPAAVLEVAYGIADLRGRVAYGTRGDGAGAAPGPGFLSLQGSGPACSLHAQQQSAQQQGIGSGTQVHGQPTLGCFETLQGLARQAQQGEVLQAVGTKQDVCITAGPQGGQGAGEDPVLRQ